MPVPTAPPNVNPETGAPRVEIRLLGPFQAARAGDPVHVGSPKQRAVLALLALQAGKVVSCDTLCDLIWNEVQPASASATLQSLISRLRGTLVSASSGLVDAGREVLRTCEPGWVLDINPEAVDALRFQDLTARARGRSGRGDAAVGQFPLVRGFLCPFCAHCAGTSGSGCGRYQPLVRLIPASLSTAGDTPNSRSDISS